MKGWRVVKITLIAFLVLANVFMIFFLQTVFHSAEYLPEESIRQARELLRADGIVIGQRVIDAKIVDLPIYEGELMQDYHASVAVHLSGSQVSRSFDAPNGVVLSMENGDRYTFSDGFDVRYTAGSSAEFLMYEAADVSSLVSSSEEEFDAARKAVTAFLERTKNASAERGQSAALGYSFTICGADQKTGIVYCVGQQSVNERTLVDFRAVFAVRGDEVIGMNGSWCFASTDGIYSAQLLDQINILYSVRNRILEERGNTAGSRVEIVSVEIGYAVYFRGDTESYYLIPAWNIQTDSGKTYSINAVDGTLYTK